ncbi:MAG: DUF6020 family protein [Lachnospiraceae bacterium]|nr:DUF6020 family protein [Lachnospiraceae bacterium]
MNSKKTTNLKDFQNRIRGFKTIKMILLLVLIVWWVLFFHNLEKINTGGSYDTYYSVFIFVGILSTLSVFDNIRSDFFRKVTSSEWKKILMISVFFPIIILLANYELFIPFKHHITDAVLCFFASYVMAVSILCSSMKLKDQPLIKTSNEAIGKPSRKKCIILFFSFFLSLSLIYTLYLIFVAYPGNVSPDSLSQIYQATTRIVSNHHPFYHTLIIKAALSLGLLIFNDINSAIAVYSLLSLLLMACAFSYVCVSLYRLKLPKFWVAFTFIISAVMPYNIVYSVTMWKDVLFSGAVASFIIATVLFLSKDEKDKISPIDQIVWVISAFAFALLRSNGLFALIIYFLVSVFFIRSKKHFFALLAIIVIAFILKHPVMNALEIKQPDTAEFLSVPEQQIARLIAEGVELEKEDTILLSKIMDLSTVPEEYNPYISNPIKHNIRRTDVEYLSDHKAEYLKLWFKLCLKHPVLYVEAWVDQTKGYWNGGYSYRVFFQGVSGSFSENGITVTSEEMGIKNTPKNSFISDLYKGWFDLWNESVFFELSRSIGLHVWFFMLLFGLGLIKKKKECLAASVPILAIVLSLVISTPLYNDFRYAYAVFTTLPVAIGTVFYRKS